MISRVVIASKMFSLGLIIGLLPLISAYAVDNSGWVRVFPSEGDFVVSPTPKAGQYANISAAVMALPSDGSTQSIFVYPGIYNEQVVLNRTGNVTIQGYTRDAASYRMNTVTITNNISAAVVGHNDLSGTVRAETPGIALYNLNIENTFGHYAEGCQCQALALSAQNSEQGYYGVKLTGYQDTLLANTGTQIYAHSYISGAVDFIFGQYSPSYFYKSQIVSISEGSITASGRLTSDSPNEFVFDQCNILPAFTAAANTTNNTYLGRPWKVYAKAIYRNSYLGPHLNKAGWSIWETTLPQTANASFFEYENYGPGAWNPDRANFSHLLTAEQADNYTIANVLGADYKTWVDTSYTVGAH